MTAAAQPPESVGLFFGGAGFIGRATCAALIERGMRPVVADTTVGTALPELEAHECDITDLAQVRAVIEKVRPQAVYHLAALLATDTKADPVLATAVNIMGTQNVLDAAARAGVPRAVYASSIAVYGDQPQWGDHVVNENDFGRPAFLYGWHKQLNEATAQSYEEQFGIRCVGLRISTVYGAGRKTGMSAPINSLIEGATTGATECHFGPDTDSCLVHVDDVGEALAILGTTADPQHSVYNVGGEFATIGQLASWIEELRPGVQIRLGEPGNRIPHVSLIDSSRISSEFGFVPRSFEAWAREALTKQAAGLSRWRRTDHECGAAGPHPALERRDVPGGVAHVGPAARGRRAPAGDPAGR
jgi:UDP-glucose 4-epimerase